MDQCELALIPHYGAFLVAQVVKNLPQCRRPEFDP